MFELRQDQHEVRHKVNAALREGCKSLIVQAATGWGKTVWAADYIKRCVDVNKKVLVLVSTRELTKQWSEKLSAVGLSYGELHGIYMAETEERELLEQFSNLPVVIASKDTHHVRRRNRSFIKADLVIVDEAHLSTTKTWHLDHYMETDARIIGLTATPARKNGKGLGEFFDLIIPAPSIKQLTNMKLLADAKYYAPAPIDYLDLGSVPKRAGDYAPTELGKRMQNPRYVGDLVLHWQKFAQGRPTLIFCVDVKASKMTRDKFEEAGIACGHLDGKTPKEEREETLAKFRSGELQILTNCQLFCYGLDIPEISCVVMARPTLSITMHLQMLGRGLRTAPGKDHLLVLDHAGNIHTHGFADEKRKWTLQNGGEPLEMTYSNVKEIQKITCAACAHIYHPQPECPNCGHRYEIQGRDVRWVHGILEPIDKITKKTKPDPIAKEQFYREVWWYAIEKGKPDPLGFTYAKFKAKYGENPIWEWRNLTPIRTSEITKKALQGLNIRWAKSKRNPNRKRAKNG